MGGLEKSTTHFVYDKQNKETKRPPGLSPNKFNKQEILIFQHNKRLTDLKSQNKIATTAVENSQIVT